MEDQVLEPLVEAVWMGGQAEVHEGGIFAQADLTALFVERRRYLHGMARRILHSDSESEDVVQEAYCRASRSLAAFEGRSSLLSWVGTIVRNESLSYLRRLRGHEPISLDSEFENPEAVVLDSRGSPASPEEICLRSEMEWHARRRLTELPPEVRQIFALYYLKELSLEEVAQRRRTSVSAVKSHLHRGKQTLRHRAGTARHAVRRRRGTAGAGPMAH